MKQCKLFIILGFIGLFTACSKEPADMAYIINDTDFHIMWYSNIDSISILPHKKVFIGEVFVENEKIISWRDYYFRFDGDQTLTKIGVEKDGIYTIYDIPDQYKSILIEISNYLHHFSISDGKYISSHYELFLTERFINQIIGTTE